MIFFCFQQLKLFNTVNELEGTAGSQLVQPSAQSRTLKLNQVVQSYLWGPITDVFTVFWMTGNLSFRNIGLQRAPSSLLQCTLGIPECMVMSLDIQRSFFHYCEEDVFLSVICRCASRKPVKDPNDDIRTEALGFISSLWIECIRRLSCATTTIEGVLQILLNWLYYTVKKWLLISIQKLNTVFELKSE